MHPTSLRHYFTVGRFEHLENLSPTLINTLERLFTSYLSECKVPSQWKTSRTVLLYKKGDMRNYHPISLLYANKQDFAEDSARSISITHTITKLIEVSRQYEPLLCLTFIDLKMAFDFVESEAVIEALLTQTAPTQYIEHFESCAVDSRPRFHHSTTTSLAS
ncbi:unnamed protein product [Heligmosomoides polygyrus]|uniref:Reverse transcriptase domain-containing protein n=1 Tax=Heligmosomoides polygyrus TaxID=6339 RepID=A0A183FVK2_HELPZ|nr:unnamed protein product [Heligmosomoides polygyrus]